MRSCLALGLASACGGAAATNGEGSTADGGDAGLSLHREAGVDGGGSHPDADGSSSDALSSHADGTTPGMLDGSSAGFDAEAGASSPDAPDGDSVGPSSGYTIDLAQTSVSGLSSGAFFAVQFHVAFSSIVTGAAIFAGGPYDCARGSVTAAETTCLSGSPDSSALVAITHQNYAAGAIDNPSNLATSHVFLFGGADDTTVYPTVVDSLDAYYEAFISSGSLKYESRHPATAHTMPTLDYGGACGETASPFVGNCDYDGAGNALQQIYGSLSAPATTLSGAIRSFSQGAFVADPAAVSLADAGYYYVPASCAAGEPCRVHISFHGCEQGAAAVGDAYYAHAGYNEWADTNHIIVLYPQVAPSSANPEGCWDFWGYDGANCDEHSGTELAAVRAMLGWLADGGGALDGGAGGTSDAGPSPTLSDGGTCVTATNLAQVAAARAYDDVGFAYALGSNEYLGPDTAAVTSSLEAVATDYYVVCP